MELSICLGADHPIKNGGSATEMKTASIRSGLVSYWPATFVSQSHTPKMEHFCLKVNLLLEAGEVVGR